MQIEEMGLQHAVRRPGDISRGAPLRGLYSCRPTYVYIDIMQILAQAGNVSSAFDVPLFCPPIRAYPQTFRFPINWLDYSSQYSSQLASRTRLSALVIEIIIGRSDDITRRALAFR